MRSFVKLAFWSPNPYTTYIYYALLIDVSWPHPLANSCIGEDFNLDKKFINLNMWVCPALHLFKQIFPLYESQLSQYNIVP